MGLCTLTRRDNIEANKIYNIKCQEGLKQLGENSIDSIVTDPPYNLKFMNKEWDDKGTPKEFQQWNKEWTELAYKVLKPGGYLIVFSGTKTYHRMVCGVEDAGFEIKDMIEWMYGTGFPKSYNISKGFDKKEGANREKVAPNIRLGDDKAYPKNPEKEFYHTDKANSMGYITKPTTDKAKKWDGWGTALKPAHEPILLAQKPREGTYCENVDKYGVGGINIDECRIPSPNADLTRKSRANKKDYDSTSYEIKTNKENITNINKGRFPANLLLTHHPDCEYKGEKKVESAWSKKGNPKVNNWVGEDKRENIKKYCDEDGLETISDWNCHSSCPVRRMNEQSGVLKSGARKNNKGEKGAFGGRCYGDTQGRKEIKYFNSSKGGAARYFNQFHFVHEDFFKYTAKTSKSERTCDGNVENDHPTVKPIELMKWLVRLVTPPGGICVDPFCGSGTTLIACYEEGFDYIGMDSDKHGCEISRERLKYHKGQPTQLKLFNQEG